MKIFSWALFSLLLSIGANAQKFENALNAKHSVVRKSSKPVFSLQKASPYTALMMLDVRNAAGDEMELDSLANVYHLIEMNNRYYAKAFLMVNSEEKLGQYDVMVSSRAGGDLLTTLVPVDQIEKLSQEGSIDYINIGEPGQLDLDKALTATSVPDVHNGVSLPQTYTGKGVIVGIIDVGFDYTHPTFYDTTGTNYRVKKVWEQEATSGNSPSGFSYGRELTGTSNILSAQTDNSNESHGTHVAGTAAGSGAGTNGVYRGVGFESDLVLVSTDMNSVSIADGISYIQSYASSVGKPCVINISIGGHVGPHDGTSAFDQYCNGVIGKGKVIVGSNGNNGSDSIHLEKAFTSLDTTLYSFIKFPMSSLGTDGVTYIDVWGEVNKNFEIAVNIYNTSTNQFEDWTPYISMNASNTYSYILEDDDTWFPDDCLVDISTSVNSLNNKPRAFISIDHTDQDDDYRWVMIEVIGKNANIDAWTWSPTYGAYFVDNGYTGSVKAGTTDGTMGEIGGSGNSIISVGAYTSSNSFTNLSSNTYYYSELNGMIAGFSSKGPTADGRMKPDIAAPGHTIVAPVNSFDSEYSSSSQRTVAGVTNGTNNWYYGAMSGTSMAAPMTTGTIALWLEAYPELTPDQVKELMKDNAKVDGFTGWIAGTGSNTWGWGKLDAHAGISDLLLQIPAKPVLTPSGSTSLCQGNNLTVTAPSGYQKYKWSNGYTSPSISVSWAGNYAVQVTNSGGYKSPWSDTTSVTLVQNPSPNITVNGLVLTSSLASSYQWFLNGVKISGAVGRSFTALQNGNYQVEVENTFGCKGQSATATISTVGHQSLAFSNLKIFPNPTSGLLRIISPNNQIRKIELYDLGGRLVLERSVKGKGAPLELNLNLKEYNTGMYVLKILTDERAHTSRISLTNN